MTSDANSAEHRLGQCLKAAGSVNVVQSVPVQPSLETDPKPQRPQCIQAAVHVSHNAENMKAIRCRDSVTAHTPDLPQRHWYCQNAAWLAD